MNPTPAAPPTHPPPPATPAVELHRPTFSQRAIEHALSRMPQGCLHITMPDGSTRRLGRAPAITAHLRIVRPGFFKRCVL